MADKGKDPLPIFKKSISLTKKKQITNTKQQHTTTASQLVWNQRKHTASWCWLADARAGGRRGVACARRGDAAGWRAMDEAWTEVHGTAKDADAEGSSLYAPLSSDPSAVFPAGCSSGYVTGLPIDTARCVVVAVDLRANNLTGTLNVTAIVNLLDWVQVLSLILDRLQLMNL